MSLGALVVGLGQVGMGYDLKQNKKLFAMTHARALSVHSGFSLIGGVDPSETRRAVFEQYYQAPGFPDIFSAMKALNPEIVIVAAPTANHCQSVCEILDTGRPLAILCEKPFSSSAAEAQKMISQARKRGCKLFINYMRRADRAVIKIRNLILSQHIKAPVKCVAWYTKGLYNNGSHILNLMQYWLGDIEVVRVLKAGRRWGGTDPEPDVFLKFKRGEVFLLSATEENFSHCTIEIIAANGRLSYEDGGKKIYWTDIIEDNVCEGYRVLNPDRELLVSDLDFIQWHVMDQVASSLRGHSVEICAESDALKTLELLMMIDEQL